MGTFSAGIEVIRDDTVPEMLRNLSGLLTHDPETIARLSEVAAGRPLLPGERVEFEIDQVTVGRLLRRVADWGAASMSEKGAIKSTASQAEALALTFKGELNRLDQERRARNSLGGKRSAKTRRMAAAEAWQVTAIERARELQKTRNKRDIASIVAKQFGKTAGTVRRVLKNAGVK